MQPQRRAWPERSRQPTSLHTAVHHRAMRVLDGHNTVRLVRHRAALYQRVITQRAAMPAVITVPVNHSVLGRRIARLVFRITALPRHLVGHVERVMVGHHTHRAMKPWT